MGPARAFGLALLGDKLSAAKAEEWGLIWRCVEDDQLDTVVGDLARQVAAGPTLGFTRTKQALQQAWRTTIDEQLDLERDSITFFPLAWTIVHPVDERSPLFGLGPGDLLAKDFEFLVIVTGTDEAFSQQVQSRSSYKPDEIHWGARFRNIYLPPDRHGMISVDVGRIDEVEPAALPG